VSGVDTDNVEVILTQDGSVVKSIPKSGYWCYVAVSQTQPTMYYRDNNDIVCRTLEGKEIFKYQNQKLNYPCGIAIDKQDTLYICGHKSNNVHKVSSDGQRSRILVDKLHNITRPWRVLYSIHTRINLLLPLIMKTQCVRFTDLAENTLRQKKHPNN